ncbi:flagellar biosynthesis protein FlhA [bacterium]|nr:flagellar biosynthesis protein FlhA [bacterium]
MFGKLTLGSNIFNAFGIVAIIGLMVLPVPPGLLDILLTFNITFALIIVLVSVYIKEPLEFSVLPSLLLIVTMFRLALNVASTRLILSEAYAGEVISSFGGFVVKGNFVIGLVIFLIIVVIQFIVITKGAGRIAEVAARFTLDAMPGKQMSIDADLNSGLITEKEAKDRREKISDEADFYGAMDGASKFVRGDAIAGIIITIINIVGGLIVGVAQGGMDVGEAARTYTMLTVGDGLVSQIPALVISTGAGIVVTRTASKLEFGQNVLNQLINYPKVIMVTAITILALGAVPGLPKLPFILLGIILLVAFMVLRQKRRQEEEYSKEEEEEEDIDPVEQDELYWVDRLEIEIGYGLIPLVSEKMGGDFLKRVSGIRKQAISDLGLHISPIRIKDNLQLKQNQYRIKLKGVEISDGTIYIDRILVIKAGAGEDGIEGIETREPAFNMPALWIDLDDADKAEALGYTVVEPSAVIATHLNEIIHRYADEIMTRQDVRDLVDKVRKFVPAVVDDLIPDQISYAFLQQVLANLLRERVSVKDLVTILETIAYYAPQSKDVDFISERVREALGRSIVSNYLGEDGELLVVTLHPVVEETFRRATQESQQTKVFSVSPAFSEELNKSIKNEVERLSAIGIQPVILCSSMVRLALRRFIESRFSYTAVHAYSEIPRETNIKAIGMVNVNEAKIAQNSGQVA